MTIVTGATGQLGSQIVRKLIERLPPEQVEPSVRDVDRAADLAALGVRVRVRRLHRPGHPRLRVRGRQPGPRRRLRHPRRRCRGAARHGPGRRPRGRRRPGALHEPPGLRPTARCPLRPTPTSLPWPPLSLAGDAELDGITPPLTSAAAYDLDDVARILTGRTVRRTVVDDEDYIRGLVANDVPEGAARMLLGIHLASRRGEFAATDPTLERLLGRPAESIETVLDRVVAGT